jgi:hypothetical protein
MTHSFFVKVFPFFNYSTLVRKAIEIIFWGPFGVYCKLSNLRLGNEYVSAMAHGRAKLGTIFGFPCCGCCIGFSVFSHSYFTLGFKKLLQRGTHF